MLSSMDAPCITWRKWSALILLLSVLAEGVASISDPASTLSLRKCRCNKEQAWDGAKCVESITTLPIYNKDLSLYQDENNRDSNATLPTYNKTPDGQDEGNNEINVEKYGALIPTNTVENVTVKELECPNNLFHKTITEDALLLRDGRLLLVTTKSVFTNDEFCVEHFWEQGNVYFDVEVCLQTPAVPRCCPENHLLDRDSSCHPQEALQAPPLQLGQKMVDWDHVEGSMVTLTCGEHEYLRYIDLRPGEAELAATHPSATLEWITPFWIAFHSWKERYCVALQEKETGELEYVAQICFKDHARYNEHQCNNSLCVRKCCHGRSLLYQGMCAEAFYDSEIWTPSKIPEQDINDQWKIVSGEPGCDGYTHVGEMHLLPNGFLQAHPDKPPFPPSQYCVDNLLDGDNITNFAILCFPPEDTSCLWRDILIKVLVGVSCVFLMVTLAVYLGVAELRDRTYGRCLISMVAAMLTAYLCLLNHLPISTRSTTSCYILAFVHHLSTLAVFFWLNVMCFDMWKTIRGSTVQDQSRTVFLWYSLYAWGCPVVVSSVTLILDITAPSNIILPMFYEGSCWFNANEAYWAYYSGFILVLVLANVVFFIHVAVTLYQKLQQRTQTFETGTSRTNKTTKTKQQMWLFTKLFVVMGVLWITDALSSLSHRLTCTYWTFTDIINALQGVFIFFVAVRNRDNLKKVKDAWRPRLHAMSKTFSRGQRSPRPSQHTLTINDTESSRKTSIISLPRKISQASNIFFPSSSKKAETLNPADSSPTGRKQSNATASSKEFIPLSSMEQ